MNGLRKGCLSTEGIHRVDREGGDVRLPACRPQLARSCAKPSTHTGFGGFFVASRGGWLQDYDTVQLRTIPLWAEESLEWCYGTLQAGSRCDLDGISTISCLSSSRVHASWAGLQKGLPTPCHTILEAEVFRQPSKAESKQSLYRLLEHSHRPEILQVFMKEDRLQSVDARDLLLPPLADFAIVASQMP